VSLNNLKALKNISSEKHFNTRKLYTSTGIYKFQKLSTTVNAGLAFSEQPLNASKNKDYRNKQRKTRGIFAQNTQLRDLFAFHTSRTFTPFTHHNTTQQHHFTENRKKEKKTADMLKV